MLCAILSETRQNGIFTVSIQHNIYPVYLYLLTRLGTPAWPLDPRPAAAAWRHSGASSVSDVYGAAAGVLARTHPNPMGPEKQISATTLLH